MTNKIIIDAWNVIWKIPRLSSMIPENLEQVRSRFNVTMKNFFQNKNVTYKIVYDGQPHIYADDQKQNPNVSFSSNPEKADDLIIKFLNKQSNPDKWTVITSDKYLSHRAKNSGARVTTAESFILRLEKSKNKLDIKDRRNDITMNKDDISYWLDKFESTE